LVFDIGIALKKQRKLRKNGYLFAKEGWTEIGFKD